MKRKISKPYPYSMTHCGYTITYECRECGCKFLMRDDNPHYCHNCGVKLDWGVVLEANEEWKKKFLDVVYGKMLPDGHFDYTERDKMLKLPGSHDYLNWLCTITDCISVWSNFYYGKANSAQMRTLLRLKKKTYSKAPDVFLYQGSLERTR